MCGIVAVIGKTKVDEQLLNRMRDRLAHRGPDGAGSWISTGDSGTVGLGHRRLSIIDLSKAAAQPMFSADGSLVIIYNGEIYNYVELREELRALQHTFRTQSDTEVILAAYTEWGVECLTRLNGMFAFALWDARQNRLFVSRDRFGEKPLYYCLLPRGGIALASEAKALFGHPDLSAALDEDGLAAYLGGRYRESDDRTLFRGIRRLPPAHAMIIDREGTLVRMWRYWASDFSAREERYREDDAIARFRHLLERSVSMRLRSDVPVGTSLSGGLDSSTIVALVARVRGESGIVTQNTFSARFDDDPTLSEGPFIDLVVRATGVKGHMIQPSPGGLIEESRRLHYYQEEPFLSASIYMQWCVMELAAANLTTVILDGQGADELLGGYQTYFQSYQRDLLETGRWWSALRETILFSRRLGRAGHAYSEVRRRFDPQVNLGLGQLARIAMTQPGPSTVDDLLGQPTRGHRFRGLRAHALVHDSLPQLLRYADRNAMAFSRETRLPFLDHELVEFVAGLPDRALVGDGWQKLLLRRAVDGLMPPEVTWRADKMGYAAPLDRWLRTDLKNWARELLFSGPITHLAAYPNTHLDMLWEQHQSGSGEHSWALWRWISLNEWLKLLDEGVWSRGIESAQLPAALSAQ